MNPDGLSYLDIATEATAHGPGSLISGYWSPAYPALIASVLAIANPPRSAQIPILHLVNFVIFLFTLWSFHSFASSFLGWNRRSKKSDQILAVPFVWTAFLFLTLQYAGPEIATPDLLVAGILFVVFRLAWKLSPTCSYAKYAQLGVALAAGCYAKASMFPLAITLLILLALASLRRRLSSKGLLLSALAFALASAPLIILVSARLGHFSFSQAPKLNYIWYANHRELTRNEGWAGQFPAADHFSHGPRVLNADPLTLEFAGPIPGTVPVWYAPDYWWDGVTPHIDIKAQLLAIGDSARNYLLMAPPLAVWTIALVALWLVARRHRMPRMRASLRMWPILWPASAIVMYGVVHVEARFLLAFVIIVLLYGYRVISRGAPYASANAITTAASAVALLMLAGHLGVAAYRGVRQTIEHRTPDYLLVSGQLDALGVRPGDKLAVAGYAFDAYYAKCSGIQITAQIQDPPAFWRATPARREQLSAQLVNTGVTAIVAQDPPAGANLEGWHIIQTASARFVVFLPQMRTSSR
jgi:hypothetical protein